jgi:L-threonylcarbamoyladenylate synthase
MLKNNAVGVIPTDTIYGIVGRAMDPKTVARIYRLRKRNPQKPFIILIPAAAALKKFGVRLDKYRQAFLSEAWPGPVSIILPAASKKFRYLHRGKGSLAFRVPADPALRALLAKTGPLVAPSANWEGKPPARTIKEAQRYFGAGADFYMDAGRIPGKSSTLIDLTGKAPVLLRK